MNITNHEHHIYLIYVCYWCSVSKTQTLHNFDAISYEIYQKMPAFCFTSESGNYKEYILQFSFAHNPRGGRHYSHYRPVLKHFLKHWQRIFSFVQGTPWLQFLFMKGLLEFNQKNITLNKGETWKLILLWKLKTDFIVVLSNIV